MANERQETLADIAAKQKSVTERHALGDAAKLREALEKARLFVGCCDSELAFVNMGCIDRNKLCEEIDAALALFTDSPENVNSGAANVTAGKQELNANSKSAQIEFCDSAAMREAPRNCKKEVENDD